MSSGHFGKAFRELDDDGSLRCVVFTGAGDEAMGPGADIAEFADQRNNSEQAAEYGGLMHAAMHAIRDCRHPVVAMIKGLCVGGALELALMCDMRICQQSSRFGVPINRLGLVMAYPEIEALIGLVGPAVALEILFEARVFDADEAKDKGLVNRVVADDEIETIVAATVKNICAGAPLVNRWHKKFARKVLSGEALTDADHRHRADRHDVPAGNSTRPPTRSEPPRRSAGSYAARRRTAWRSSDLGFPPSAGTERHDYQAF